MNDSIMRLVSPLSWKCLVLTVVSLICAFKAYPASVDEVKTTPYIVGINPESKFVWFRVAKVGSTTVRDVFRKNHIDMSYKSECFTFKPSNFKDYFKFAFVRNPWDRVVSCYCQKVENKNPNWAFYYSECFDKGFDYFVDFIDKKDLSTADRHIRLQTKLIPVNEVNFIGRLENFKEDFQYILSVLGVENREIPQKNPSTHVHYSAYYNDQTRETIAKKYKKDIEVFGYVFECQ